jgi:hypothetical protein
VKVMDLKIGFFLLSLPLNVDNRFSKFDVKHYSSRVSLVFSSFLKFFLSSLFSRQFF